VFRTWAEARPLVDGYSGAVHKRFGSHEKAAAYVRTHGVHALSDDEEDEYEACPRGDDSPSPGSFPSLTDVGPDPSSGKSTEFFGRKVQSESAMRKEMEPDGLTATISKKLAATTLDATALPGTSPTKSTDDSDLSLLTGALMELTAVRKNDSDATGVREDFQWKQANRTSLRSVSTHEKLVRRLRDLQSVKNQSLQNVLMTQRAVLEETGWETIYVQAWTQLNLYYRISTDTLDSYIALHSVLVALSQEHGWAYAQEALEFHVDKMSSLRSAAMSRLQALVAVYIYLRDAQANQFSSPRLQEKRNQAFQSKLEELQVQADLRSRAASALCPKCKGNGLVHPTGRENCIFRNEKDATARKRAALIMRAQAGDMDEE